MIKLYVVCNDSTKSGDELTRKVNRLLNKYALNGKDATLLEALQTENQKFIKKTFFSN